MEEHSEAWDWKELSRFFLKKATEADTAYWEVRKTAQHNPVAQETHDKALAEFSVYHHLWGKSFLQSKQSLLHELHALLTDIVVDEKAYNPDRFTIHYIKLVNEFIAFYQKDQRFKLLWN